MKKKVIVIFGILILLCFVFWIYNQTRSAGGLFYTSVSDYVKENGDCFYDFYDPEMYFNKNATKQTLKEKDTVNIYHYNDPKYYYSLYFKKVKDTINLNIIVDRNMEEDYELDSSDKITIQDKDMYIDIDQDWRISIVYPQEDQYINVIFEFKNLDEKEVNELVDIGTQMIIDSINLN